MYRQRYLIVTSLQLNLPVEHRVKVKKRKAQTNMFYFPCSTPQWQNFPGLEGDTLTSINHFEFR